MGRGVRVGAILLLALIVAGMAGWATLWLWLSPLPNELLRTALAAAFALGTLIAFMFFKRRWRTLAVFVVVFAGLVAWYYAVPPSNDRVWDPSVAKIASATVNGDLVTIRNIRNFDYRTETDFTPRYYDRTFDLAQLDRVDLVAVYWMGPAIAHLFVSFGFGDDHLAISIEARKERSEGYSALGGFFRQYELVYVVADERDVIRLRTNYRKDPPEDVYLFRTRASLDNGPRVFLD